MSDRPLPRIGAQVSTAGGLSKAVARARAIGAEVVQIFPSNPRRWQPCPYTEHDIAAFTASLRRAALPLFVHTIYLINLASPDEDQRRRSTAALADALVFGARSGADGVVTHIGSHRGDGYAAARKRVVRAVTEARAQARERVQKPLPALLLETSAGGGDSLGRTPAELGDLVGAFPEGLGICLDSAHLFAAGYAVDTVEGLDALLVEIERHGLLGALGLVHLNDCKTALGSRSDRHENLWEGRLGRSGLRLFLGHTAFRRVPFVLEVPGFADHGPDVRNIRRARLMRREILRPEILRREILSPDTQRHAAPRGAS